jgi:hypothetical protein
MIELPQEYTLRGRKEWRYKILKREGDVVIVEMYRIDRKGLEDVMSKDTLQGYEVFVVQKYPDRPRPDGKGMILAKEAPPSDFLWGRSGFTFAGVDLKSGGCLIKAEAEFQRQLIAQVERLKKRSDKEDAAIIDLVLPEKSDEQQVEEDMLTAQNESQKIQKKAGRQIKSVEEKTKKSAKKIKK